MTRGFFSAAVALFVLIFLPSEGAAQLLSDRLEGLSRICTYSAAPRILSGTETRAIRVGIGENCPFTFPAESPGELPAPPTAQLRTETVIENARSCVYEQADSEWTLHVDISRSCPLFAGMIAESATRGSRK